MKTLTSTFLENSKEKREIKVGDEIRLLDPSIFQNSLNQRNQRYVNRMVRKEIGKGPYEVLEIYQKNQVVYLKLKGKRGKVMENIIREYFDVC
jgi:hypothetical protein